MTDDEPPVMMIKCPFTWPLKTRPHYIRALQDTGGPVGAHRRRERQQSALVSAHLNDIATIDEIVNERIVTLCTDQGLQTSTNLMSTYTNVKIPKLVYRRMRMRDLKWSDETENTFQK